MNDICLAVSVSPVLPDPSFKLRFGTEIGPDEMPRPNAPITNGIDFDNVTAMLPSDADSTKPAVRLIVPFSRSDPLPACKVMAENVVASLGSFTPAVTSNVEVDTVPPVNGNLPPNAADFKLFCNALKLPEAVVPPSLT